MDPDEQSMLIAEFEHWELFLHEDASPYLGRCVAWARRPGAERFVDMTREEGEELQRVVRIWLEALSKWLASEGQPAPHRENISILGNSEPHLHAHLIPRYLEPVTVSDVTFTDPRPRHHYKPYEKATIPVAVLESIRDALREQVAALHSISSDV